MNTLKNQWTLCHRYFCDTFLSKKNYHVATASDGLDGLKLLETEKPGFDLVITDLVMPNISGVAVISIIKKNCGGVHFSFWFVTKKISADIWCLVFGF